MEIGGLDGGDPSVAGLVAGEVGCGFGGTDSIKVFAEVGALVGGCEGELEGAFPDRNFDTELQGAEESAMNPEEIDHGGGGEKEGAEFGGGFESGFEGEVAGEFFQRRVVIGIGGAEAGVGDEREGEVDTRRVRVRVQKVVLEFVGSEVQIRGFPSQVGNGKKGGRDVTIGRVLRD